MVGKVKDERNRECRVTGEVDTLGGTTGGRSPEQAPFELRLKGKQQVLGLWVGRLPRAAGRMRAEAWSRASLEQKDLERVGEDGAGVVDAIREVMGPNHSAPFM